MEYLEYSLVIAVAKSIRTVGVPLLGRQGSVLRDNR